MGVAVSRILYALSTVSFSRAVVLLIRWASSKTATFHEMDAISSVLCTALSYAVRMTAGWSNQDVTSPCYLIEGKRLAFVGNKGYNVGNKGYKERERV